MPESNALSTARFYLRLACHVAKLDSHDPHTHNGAVLVNENGLFVAAANQFPTGVIRDGARLERPTKYSYIEHAERNVIYTAAQQGFVTKRATLYCPWFACADCARAIICAGITKVVGLAHPPAHGSWQESCDRGDEMFREAGVEFYRLEEKLGTFALRDGKQVEV
jgi:dCMP deaminase